MRTAPPDPAVVPAIVTGASGTVGAAIAARLSGRGHPVVLVGRCAEQLARVAAEIDGPTLSRAGDLRDPGFVASVLTQGREAFGLIGILVNAAGSFGPVGVLDSIEIDAWAATMSLNAVAPLRLMQAVRPDMSRRGFGRIVNISSAQTLYPPDPLVSAYATSKHALNWLTRCVAVETAGTDIAACVVHPGDLRSNMWSDIRDKARGGGDAAEHLREWTHLIESTGGDDPAAVADLVEDVVNRAPEYSNGRFLMIPNGIIDHARPTW